jgi:hypothetical protein
MGEPREKPIDLHRGRGVRGPRAGIPRGGLRHRAAVEEDRGVRRPKRQQVEALHHARRRRRRRAQIYDIMIRTRGVSVRCLGRACAHALRGGALLRAAIVP